MLLLNILAVLVHLTSYGQAQESPKEAVNLPCYDSHHLIGWLKSHQKQGLSLFCRDEVSEESISEGSYAFYTQGVKSCITRGTLGGVKFDSVGRPFGRGHFHRGFIKQADHIPPENDKFCINIHEDVKSLHSGFVKGYPEGNIKISFTNGEHLEGRSVHGVLHGKTRIYGRDNRLKFLGTFLSGRPYGWSWIYPHDFEKSGIIVAYFDENGALNESQVIYLRPKVQGGHMGKLENDTILKVEEDISLTDSVEENCIYQIKYSKFKKTRETLVLPVIIRNINSITGLHLHTNQIYMFNRIAKTGSQSITELLVSLKPKTGVNPKIDISRVESLMEPFNIVKSYADTINYEMTPSVFIRHYNFIDFKKHGFTWSPIYINIVRNPIERVISWFYYQRASWNIVERIQTFPNEPLPDSKFLRKDFPTCVVDPNDDECNFVEGTSNIDYPDHRSQMMAFCGHDLYCADFNSQKVLQMAKENVDRFYPVVGILEALNQSLTVFEHTFPTLFTGALDLYHSSQKVKNKRIINNLKPSIPSEIIDILNRNFTREIEFYEFCKQRLAKQYETVLKFNKKNN